MFPNSWPGRGLPLLRVSVDVLLLHQSLLQSPGTTHLSSVALVSSVIVSLLSLLGVWTAATGVVLAPLEILKRFSGTDQAAAMIMVA